MSEFKIGIHLSVFRFVKKHQKNIFFKEKEEKTGGSGAEYLIS
jgi:hypothetical protein